MYKEKDLYIFAVIQSLRHEFLSFCVLSSRQISKLSFRYPMQGQNLVPKDLKINFSQNENDREQL